MTAIAHTLAGERRVAVHVQGKPSITGPWGA